MDAREWLELSYNHDNITTEFFRRFECSRVTPEMLDALLADAWRHHGTIFFRDMFNVVGDYLRLVVPLRVRVREFEPSRSQRRILRRNADLRWEFGDAELSPMKDELFNRHAERFNENRPQQLSDFLAHQAHFRPCRTLECRVFLAGELVATSFVSQGKTALSSIYAMFEPDEARRSLGIFTLLREIEFAQRGGYEFLYLGYAHAADSYYDYKKGFAACEYFDWRRGWLPYDSKPVASDLHPLDGLEVRSFLDEADA